MRPTSLWSEQNDGSQAHREERRGRMDQTGQIMDLPSNRTKIDKECNGSARDEYSDLIRSSQSVNVSEGLRVEFLSTFYL